jgi:hypothetical protein
MISGSGSHRLFRERLEIRGAQGLTTDFLSKRFSGLFGLWRDLPQDFGNWNSVFQRFRRWVRSGVFDQMFEALAADADFEYIIVDGTIVRVHQHGSGARGGTQAIGRSRGGLTIVALVDALGNLVRFVLLPDTTAPVSPRF